MRFWSAIRGCSSSAPLNSSYFSTFFTIRLFLTVQQYDRLIQLLRDVYFNAICGDRSVSTCK